jgi:hypothetical protein
MRPRTLHRRGGFYHRKRSHWRLNLALVLIGAALAGFVVAGMRAEGPVPGPAEDTAKQIAAAAPTTHAPARTAPADRGSTTLVTAASAPISAKPPRPGRPGSLVVAERSPDANWRNFGGVGARSGLSTVRDAKVKERAPGPGMLVGAVMPSPAQAERCKTCGDEVPF